MLFTSLTFLHIFLPLFLLVYLILKTNQSRNLVLLIFSIIFYTIGENWLVLLLLSSAIVDFYSSKIIESGHRYTGLIISLCFNIGILVYFKYSSFIISNINLLFETNLGVANIHLPLGISFFTFQTMSYTIDVFHGKVRPSSSLRDFSCYVTMFPQLIAGPIVRYNDISKNLQSRSISSGDLRQGFERFVIGLAKKVLIANYFGYLADTVFNLNYSSISPTEAWMGIFFYSIQIYYDFSGYTDMAIGIGQMLGFSFPENFNYPYISKSIREFWRRWHISMSTWFRDYVYIPLGGNQVSKYRNLLNLLIVFFVTGLWHGADWAFIVWGFIHGFFIIIERMLYKMKYTLPKVFTHIYTLLVVGLAWVFFRVENVSASIQYIKRCFHLNYDLKVFPNIFYLVDIKMVLMSLIAIFFATPIFCNIMNLVEKSDVARFLYGLIIVLLFFTSLGYISLGSYDPFIYFRF